MLTGFYSMGKLRFPSCRSREVLALRRVLVDHAELKPLGIVWVFEATPAHPVRMVGD